MLPCLPFTVSGCALITPASAAEIDGALFAFDSDGPDIPCRTALLARSHSDLLSYLFLIEFFNSKRDYIPQAITILGDKFIGLLLGLFTNTRADLDTLHEQPPR